MLTTAQVSGTVRSLTGLDLRSVRAWWASARRRETDHDPGPHANRRLTAVTGVVVLPLAALVLLTGLLFGSLWPVHYFLGYLLLPLVLLKLASTTYRMLRYYLRSGAYRLVRPPYPLGRLTSPLLAVSVVVLFTSGIVMWLTHSQRDPWGWLHTDAAIAFSVLVAVHLGMYVPEALHAADADLRTLPPRTQRLRRRRLAVLAAAVLAGLVLAGATVAFARFPTRAHRVRPERPRAVLGAAGDALWPGSR